MQLETGKRYLTRDGNVALLGHTAGPGGWPVRGVLVNAPEGWRTELCWDRDGRYSAHPGGHPKDIVEPLPEPVVFGPGEYLDSAGDVVRIVHFDSSLRAPLLGVVHGSDTRWYGTDGKPLEAGLPHLLPPKDWTAKRGAEVMMFNYKDKREFSIRHDRLPGRKIHRILEVLNDV